MTYARSSIGSMLPPQRYGDPVCRDLRPPQRIYQLVRGPPVCRTGGRNIETLMSAASADRKIDARRFGGSAFCACWLAATLRSDLMFEGAGPGALMELG
jgi:hypothetical protein